MFGCTEWVISTFMNIHIVLPHDTLVPWVARPFVITGAGGCQVYHAFWYVMFIHGAK